MRAWLIGSLLLASVPALAQSDEDEARAKELFDNGSILYDEGRYEEAVTAFRAAYDLSKKPLLLYNMASPLERLGRWKEALDALQDYRAFAAADERENIESRIRNIQQRIDERKAAEVVPDPVVPDPVTPVVAPVVPVPDPDPVVVKRGNPAAMALIATGGAGLGVGAVFTGLTLQSRAQWKELCVDRLCPTEAESFIKQDNGRGLVADVGWIVGIGALGTGVAISLGGKGSADLEVLPAPNGLLIRGGL